MTFSRIERKELHVDFRICRCRQFEDPGFFLLHIPNKHSRSIWGVALRHAGRGKPPTARTEHHIVGMLQTRNGDGVPRVGCAVHKAESRLFIGGRKWQVAPAIGEPGVGNVCSLKDDGWSTRSHPVECPREQYPRTGQRKELPSSVDEAELIDAGS